MSKQQKKPKAQESRGVSDVDRVRLRVSAMIGSPKAQADRRATIWPLDSDTKPAWDQVLEELAETDGLKMIRNEDGTVLLKWQPGEEGDAVAGADERYVEEMVVQRIEEPAPF